MLAAEKRQCKAGMAARKRGVSASVCPFGLIQMRLRSWWLVLLPFYGHLALAGVILVAIFIFTILKGGRK